MTNKIKVHYSSASNEWATPLELFKRIESVFGPFDLDPCCTKETAKCSYFFTEKTNGLLFPWDMHLGRPTKVFMNPPYGREIGKWVQKAYEESLTGNVIVVCLIPARTDTKWWHKYCMRAPQIILIEGRIKFEQNGKVGTVSAPFPSCIVVFSTHSCKIKIDRRPVFDTMHA